MVIHTNSKLALQLITKVNSRKREVSEYSYKDIKGHVKINARTLILPYILAVFSEVTLCYVR